MNIMANKLISIGVLVYNHEKFINKTLIQLLTKVIKILN